MGLPVCMNAQVETGDTVEIDASGFIEEPGTNTVIFVDPAVNKTKVFWFNPFTAKMFIVSSSSECEGEINVLIHEYFQSMKSLKGTPYEDGDLWKISNLCRTQENPRLKAALRNELLEKRPDAIYTSVKSYNPRNKMFLYKSNVAYSGDNSSDKMVNEILAGVEKWLNNLYIEQKTKGKYKTVEDFQAAFDKGEKVAVKSAKRMR